MALITLRRDGSNRIAVDAPHQFREILKGCPGSRKEQNGKRFTFPWTPQTLLSLKAALEEVWEIVGISPAVRALMEEAKISAEVVARVRESAKGLPPIPITGKLKPWDHQLQAYHFAKPLPGCLFYMAVGTGKSRVVVDLLQNDPDRRHNLIVAPKKVVDNVWQRQFDAHWVRKDRMPLLVQAGKADRLAARAEEMFQSGPGTIITTYQTAWREPFASWALQQSWDMVTLDEIHRAKAAGGKTSMFFSRLSSRTRFRLGLSGTPIPNGLQDSYGIYRFLDPGVFGTNYEQFCNRYVVFGGFNNYQIMGYSNEEEWNRKFYSIAFHVPDDVLKLPKPRFMTYGCDMDAKARVTYNTLDKEFVSIVKDGVVSAKNILAKMARLQQITSGFLQLDLEPGQGKIPIRRGIDDAKIRLLEDTLEDIDREEPIVVFYRFKPDAVEITRVLRGLGWTVAEMSGDKDELQMWQRGEKSALVVQVAAGQEGNDMTRARYGIFYSMSFGYGDWVQLVGRLVRPGQQRTATFIRLQVNNSIDEDIWAAIDHKCDVTDWVLHRINGTPLPGEIVVPPPKRRPRRRKPTSGSDS